MLVLAMMIAPASRRFFVSVASYGGIEPLERHRAAGGRHVGRVDVVLERDRNAVQRAADLALRALAVALVGFLQRVGIDRERGVEAIFVERDARQVLLHEIARRRAPLLHRLAQVGDRRLDDVERLRQSGRGRRRLAAAAHGEDEHERRRQGHEHAVEHGIDAIDGQCISASESQASDSQTQSTTGELVQQTVWPASARERAIRGTTASRLSIV